ncbi:sensor histidine kinase [Paenibacillus solisilvae]|uniref:histidine kinase n=1 Tax=Paenibacillus solisilvae TaxID=2486751 RepID=A0ABW0VQN4_9BACL
MKLRVYLLMANAASILAIVVLLVFFYQYMLLSQKQFIWLSSVSLGAGLLSGTLHFILVRPVEQAVLRIREGSARIAEGDFGARVAQVGPVELKQLAGQFNDMGSKLAASFEQLQAAETARRELVANMAHDLRTPLASLQAYAEALEDGVVQDEATVRRYMATIRTESIRLGRLMQQLFELSTLDAVHPLNGQAGGDGLGSNDNCLLEDVLVELLPRFGPPLEAKSITLEVKVPEQPFACLLSSQSLQRILQNLLENAIRYSPDNGMIFIEGQINDDGRIQIAVSDSGEGVAQQERERIFDRFYRVDRSRGRGSGGAGLGLSIAKWLVEQAGGEIGVVCGEERGSTFWFTVPAAESERLQRRLVHV